MKEALGQAIRRFMGLRAQSLLVTSEGQAVGILRLSDVFEELAESDTRAGGGLPRTSRDHVELRADVSKSDAPRHSGLDVP